MAKQFFGHCQICGRQHKADASTVATHGYTIQNGWQQGACYGSGGKPIEVSCDLIEGAMVQTQQYIERAEDEWEILMSAMLSGNSEEVKELHIRKQVTTRTGTKVQAYIVTLEEEGQYIHAVARGERVARFRHDTVENVRNLLIARRCEYVNADVAAANESLKSLQKRLSSWAPSDLIPATEEDRKKSDPKLHLKAMKWGYHSTACTHSASAAQRSGGKWIAADDSQVTCTACLKIVAERNAAK